MYYTDMDNKIKEYIEDANKKLNSDIENYKESVRKETIDAISSKGMSEYEIEKSYGKLQRVKTIFNHGSGRFFRVIIGFIVLCTPAHVDYSKPFTITSVILVILLPVLLGVHMIYSSIEDGINRRKVKQNLIKYNLMSFVKNNK